jgi:hypothetical protein
MELLNDRLALAAAAAAVMIVALTACQDRNSPPSSGDYSTPSRASVLVPGQGTDVTAKGPGTGMVGGESGTVGSGGTPGSGSTSGAGTGAAVSSDSKVDTRM